MSDEPADVDASARVHAGELGDRADAGATEVVAQVLDRCVSASAWCPDVDPAVALTVLAGALGVHEDEPAALPPAAVARHAALLLAHVLTDRDRPLAPSLEAALGELARSETVEMP